jgi:hypothetical protein
MAGDQLRAQPGGLHDAQPLRQHRPRRSLVRGMETARAQPRQPRLRVADHPIPVAHLRPATGIDIQRQEPARLRRRRLKITIAGHHQMRGIPGLGHLYFGAAPVPLGTEDRVQPGPAGWPASTAGVKPSQNRRLVSSDHGPRTSNSATRLAIACSARSPIPAP